MEQYFHYQLNTATLKSRMQKKPSAKKHRSKKTRCFKRGFRGVACVTIEFKFCLIEEG